MDENSHPDCLVVGAGQQLRAIFRELDPLDPAQVAAAVRPLLLFFKIPQLKRNHTDTNNSYYHT